MLTGTLNQVYLHTIKSCRLLMSLLKAETSGCLNCISFLLLYTQRDEPHRRFFFFVGCENLRAI